MSLVICINRRNKEENQTVDGLCLCKCTNISTWRKDYLAFCACAQGCPKIFDARQGMVSEKEVGQPEKVYNSAKTTKSQCITITLNNKIKKTIYKQKQTLK